MHANLAACADCFGTTLSVRTVPKESTHMAKFACTHLLRICCKILLHIIRIWVVIPHAQDVIFQWTLPYGKGPRSLMKTVIDNGRITDLQTQTQVQTLDRSCYVLFTIGYQLTDWLVLTLWYLTYSLWFRTYNWMYSFHQWQPLLNMDWMDGISVYLTLP